MALHCLNLWSLLWERSKHTFLFTPYHELVFMPERSIFTPKHIACLIKKAAPIRNPFPTPFFLSFFSSRFTPRSLPWIYTKVVWGGAGVAAAASTSIKQDWHSFHPPSIFRLGKSVGRWTNFCSTSRGRSKRQKENFFIYPGAGSGKSPSPSFPPTTTQIHELYCLIDWREKNSSSQVCRPLHLSPL